MRKAFHSLKWVEPGLKPNIEEIKPKVDKDIELEDGIPFYCKVQMGYRKPPILVSLSCSDESHVTFYGSFENSYPNRMNHQAFFKGPPREHKIEVTVFPQNNTDAETFGNYHTFFMCINGTQ